MNKKTIKHPPMDLSRFAKCTIKTPAICDLLLIEEFKAAVDAYQGEIDDKWVIDLTFELGNQFRTIDMAKQMLAEGDSSGLHERYHKYGIIRTKLQLFRKKFSELCPRNEL